MRGVFFLVFLMSSLVTIAQTSNDTDVLISYRIDFKARKDREVISTENSLLVLKKTGGSIFMLENMLHYDRLQRQGPLNVEELLLYKSFVNYIIQRDEEQSLHYEFLGNELFVIKEQAVLDWKLSNEEKQIGDYSCKKAEVNYGGRTWIAWYTSEIPISEGPYKFHGLPGLILEVSDLDNLYHFSMYELKFEEFDFNPKIANYFPSSETLLLKQEIQAEDYYALRNTFYNKMSLHDRLVYMNRNNNSFKSLHITTLDGEKVRINTKSKQSNFIEKYIKN